MGEKTQNYSFMLFDSGFIMLLSTAFRKVGRKAHCHLCKVQRLDEPH